MAAIPGAAFNLLAFLLVRFFAPRQLRTVDWEVIASLFDLSVAGNTFSQWIKTGSMLGPAVYLGVVVAVAIVWSMVAVRCVAYVAVHYSPRDIPFGVLILLSLALLPFLAYMSDRFEPHNRDIAIKLDTGKVLFGRAVSFEYSADRLTAVLVRKAAQITSLSELLLARSDAASAPKWDSAYTTYIPADKIDRMVVFAEHSVTDEQLLPTVGVLELTNETVDEGGA